MCPSIFEQHFFLILISKQTKLNVLKYKPIFMYDKYMINKFFTKINPRQNDLHYLVLLSLYKATNCMFLNSKN